jgi:hypothetical protein
LSLQTQVKEKQCPALISVFSVFLLTACAAAIRAPSSAPSAVCSIGYDASHDGGKWFSRAVCAREEKNNEQGGRG